MNIKRIAVISAVLSLCAAAPAFAQVGVGVSTNLNIGISSTNKASSSAANANASVTAKAHTSANSAVTATSSSAYNTFNGSIGSSSNSLNAALHPFSISRSDLAASTTGYMSASNVASSDDFSVYAKSLMMADENIAKVETDDSQVSVWYREPVKFLGVVPVTVTVRATVDASGTVSVAYPWWYSLFVKDDTQDQFKTDIDNTAGTLARGEATSTLSSSAKARLVNALQSIMKTRSESVSATTSSETTAY